MQLTSVDEVRHRQEVLRDLEHGELREGLGSFGGKMQNMRECLSQASKLHQCGTFVPAESFSANVCSGVFTLQASRGRHHDQRQAGRGTRPDVRDH
jgi:hypothetical protein